MPYYITGTVRDLGEPAARPVAAYRGNRADTDQLGDFLTRAYSGHDGIYVVGFSSYSDEVFLVGLDVTALPRSQPGAIDWKTPVLIGDHLAEVLIDNPAGFWRLNETGGLAAIDASGNVKDGRYSGAVPGYPPITPSQEGYSAYFDYNPQAAVSRISVPTLMPTQQTNPDLSVEMWYRTEVSTRMMILWDRSSTGSPMRRFWVTLNKQGPNYAEGHVTVSFQGPSAFTSQISTVEPIDRLTDGVSHMLAVTKVGNQISVYLDGAWQQMDGQLDITGPFHNGQTHLIGCSADFLAGEKFEGYLSEVGYFHTGLSAERVRAHFSSSF